MDEADIYIKLSEAAAIARQKRLKDSLSEEERLRLIHMVLDIEKIKERYFELEIVPTVCHICHKPNDQPGEMWCSGAHPRPDGEDRPDE